MFFQHIASKLYSTCAKNGFYVQQMQEMQINQTKKEEKREYDDGKEEGGGGELGERQKGGQ